MNNKTNLTDIHKITVDIVKSNKAKGLKFWSLVSVQGKFLNYYKKTTIAMKHKYLKKHNKLYDFPPDQVAKIYFTK